MEVKKYTGETIQDAVFKVKADLGPEAVIIDRREYQEGGIFGFFAKTKVEILAAVETKTAADNPEKINPIKEFINEVKDPNNDVDSEKTKAKNLDLKAKADPGQLKNNFSAETKLADKIKSKQKDSNSISKADDNIYNYLLAQGVKARFVTKFIRKLEKELAPAETAEDKLADFCRQYFNFKKGITLAAEQKVISFIGPTGVGKTTTIAKVAALFSMAKNKKVGLITADTYRIAAVEQLRTYSEIIELPFAVSYSGQKLKKLIINQFGDCDLVLIDTPGSSWKDEAQLQRLKSYTESDFIDETHLVLSLNTKSSDLSKIINRFAVFNPDHLLLTKLDETETYGDLINLKEDYGLPYSYLSFGQDVPEDIEAAAADNIRKYLFGDYYA